ncbi:hypothetical protein FSP39_002361 [Pinctada imbricata]|uniref:UvrD-like helicase ATP-binding domain-containing protein n=1 Tax=Pinctada imbricata TaxID=66713 RepID=A0AA88YAX4_PINIB|nr:hypothetical protein FSP39_002361 [Pinctada imbricata]
MAARLRQSKNIKGIRIHNNQEKEFKISQLADDTTLFLRTKADITKALNLIEEFGTLSGLILNRSKCQGLKLGGKEIIEDDFEEIDWESKLIKALGIYFGKDCEIAINENWERKIVKIEKIVTAWFKRKLTMIGKIQIINSLIISQLTHLVTVMPLPSVFLKRIESLIYKFLWDNKQEKLKRKTISQKYENGGLNLIDISTHAKTMIISWGHWRRAQLLRQLEKPREAFLAFMEGYNKSTACSQTDRLNFLVEAAVSFTSIKGMDEKEDVFDQFENVPRDDTWQTVLFRLNIRAGFLKALKFQDINGNSPYHALYMMSQRPSLENLLLVTKFLLSVGLSISTKNNVGHMPLHYLKPEDGQLFKIVKASTKATNGGSSINKTPANVSMQDVLNLKTKGNEAFHMGRFPEAIQHYSDAICVLEHVKTDESNSRQFAVLYGNRAECHMKLGHNAAARKDAVESVSHDGHWYKAHLRVGKAQAACGNIEIAFKATMNSFESIEDSEPENVRREVLGELMKHSEKMILKQPQANIRGQLRNLKGTPGELWAKVAYDLIKENQWNMAKEAYQNFNSKNPSIIRFSVDLKPMCNMDQVERESSGWILDLMTYFLCCGSDHKQISLQRNDTYLHAIVRLSLVSGSMSLLEYIINNVVKPKQEQNIVDEKGNTALHAATREGRTQPLTRVHVVIFLIEETDIDTMKKNKDGKLAIEYLPKGEVKLGEFLINRMTTQDDLTKQMKKQRMKQEEEKRRQETERKKQEMDRKRREDMERRNQEKQKVEPDKKTKKEAQKENQKPQNRGPPQDQCVHCLELLEQARDLIEESKKKAYNEFAKILQKKHNSPQHKKIEEDVLQIIVRSMGRVLNPEIPERLAKIPLKLYEKLVAGLASAEKWQQMDIAVQEYRRHHGNMALGDFAKSLSVAKVIRITSIQDQQLVVQIIRNMLLSGAVLAQEGKLAILGAVQEYRFRVLEEIIRQGANPAHLTLIKGDTPMIAALCIALERDKGNFALLNLFFEMYGKDPEKYSMLDPSLTDWEGNSMFHIVARAKYNSTTQKATELLCDKKVSALRYNNEGKLPKDYLNKKNDRRLQFFRLASVGSTAEKPAPKKKQEKKVSESEGGTSKEIDDEVAAIVKEAEENNNDKSPKQLKSQSHMEKAVTERKIERVLPAKASQRREAIRGHIEDMIYSLPDIPYSIFNPRQPVLGDDNMLKKLRQKRQQSQEEAVKKEPEKQFDPQVFDNMEWEVECTADVWRTLRDKHILPELKQRVIRKIQLLAKGEWRPHLCKELKNVPETLKLYEAKLSKGGRILWELAIAFSPRLSESAERRLQLGDTDKEQPVRGGRIYSEVIRVWDVIFDHDKIYRSVQRIIKSHHRGEECIIQKKLKGIKQEQFQGGVTRRIPMIFTETDAGLDQREVQEWQQELQKYFPPASSNETEYHILKFYAFSSNLVSHVLQNLEMKVDFPFRVTDLEHAIINLQSNAPILLLGRSGTGKTTCCLYRLWSQFVSYWTSASKAESKLLPRCIVYRQDDGTEETDVDVDEDVEDLEEEEDNVEPTPGSSDQVDPEAEEEGGGQIYDHLQQLFITKNSVLCAEVQKNFRELSHACDLAKDHVAMEMQGLPYRLQDVNEFQFPLFITSRQLLLMLDASLEPPYFFNRNEDGSMRVDVQGWTDGDSPLSYHPLMEDDSEDEDEKFEDNEMDEDLDIEGEGPQNPAAKQKVDPRREVTYQIFAEEVWPHICKKYAGKYHPSLVWMEVMSFIKGSFEALSKSSGSLNLQEYLSLGKKRAPNFSGEREHIYKIFLAYEHFKKQRFLFDETDLVRNVYSRLRKEPLLKWIIHQIYVDETQDFTQAELCLLLHICNNPNQMFLTGDTAQSIMRGISFRFNDLRSLFFYARGSMHAVGKTSAVEVPKQVYQLTHNYRSHAGILSLASSILDLMIEFFPESFDRLGKDQGLFQGPAPVLLESCSFSDLAMLLRGNKRKTSHIEFGAHQAILVVNDAARENIPEELQLGLILTIYEAKGLEFDDILLYNFFHDSQANKEWRVITEYLERLYSTHTEKTTKAMSESSLVELDAEILQQSGRPRALTFDPNQHKVLNSELKHLYTAVTRARVNVWVFDSHLEKRAPMFEYFKARKLVRSITSEDVEGASCDGVFAEESSEEEWIKRGEDFMKHSLYEVAAKCFLRGGDSFMQSVAMAHQKALKASRMKDNPIKMREEFLQAAESFLECELPNKAVICLQNARERELVAHLYEKTGQLERAGETYRRLRRPVEGSRCYEQLGKFNLAVETLYENEMYDMAIDTLQRYKMLLQELRRKGQIIPAVLYQYGPHRHHTLEQLSYKAAELYHSLKNLDRMMGALARLPNLEDQTRFLIQRNYTQEAAKLLQRHEQYEKASDLYAIQGMTKEALECARKSGNKWLIGKSLLIDATLAVRKHELHHNPDALENICQDLETAFDLFQQQDRKDEAGEASLLRGQITGKIVFLKKAFGAFSNSIVKNEAGMLECMDWMVTMSLIAKTYYGDSFFFILPESYISTVYFVDATFMQEQGVPTFEAIQRFRMWRNFRYDHFPQRLGYITRMLWSESGNRNLIRMLFKTNAEDGCIKEGNYGFAERVLTLALVCLCNIGHSISADKESEFMKQIYKIKIRDCYPPRLCRVLNAVQQAQSQQEVASALMALLRERENEKLLYCEWRGGREGIWHEPLLIKHLNSEFYHDTTVSYRVDPFVVEEGVAEEDNEPLVNEEDLLEDLSITMEEKMKRDRQQREEEMQEKRKHAAGCILRCTRSFLLRIKVAEKGKLKFLVEKQLNSEKKKLKMKIFESAEIFETHCGVCGIPFFVPEVKVERSYGIDSEHSLLQRQQSTSNQHQKMKP